MAQRPPERNERAVRLAGLFIAVLAGVALVAGFASGRSATSGARPGASPAHLVPLAGRTLYFAGFDDFPAENITMLVDYYRAKYGVQAKVLRPASLDPNAWDDERGQVVAERVIASLKSVHGDVASDPGAVIIGLVADDLYIRDRPDWAWALGLRAEGRFAVVSTAHMRWPGGAGVAAAPARLRKMVSKNVGLMYFGLSVSDDRHSVLYRDIGGVDDLDRMGEDF